MWYVILYCLEFYLESQLGLSVFVCESKWFISCLFVILGGLSEDELLSQELYIEVSVFGSVLVFEKEM